ncbi:MAG: hypothetical protein KAW89_04255, partial [Armatimonadetes bacterium]|nr:hypothetical protein [Armatimonadota bacterium]
MTSLSAVVSITVALLGGPQGLGPFTAEGPYAGRLAPLGYGLPLQGEKIMYDAAAGLTTIVGPDWETIRWTLFKHPFIDKALPPPGLEGKGMALQIQSKAVKVGEEQSFDFPW